LRPHAVVKGREHQSAQNPEREAVRSYGGHLVFSAGEAHFSTADLMLREDSLAIKTQVCHEPEFLVRHGSSLNKISKIVERFSGLKVAVLGELIVDEYISCDPLGMSQEDPTIVVTPIESRVFTGGAGIVAGHMVGLGAEATFISITGDDEISTRSEAALASFGVRSRLIRDGSRPTVLKQRYRAANKTLLRVSHLRSHDVDEEFVSAVLEYLDKLLPTIHLLVFSDFNYGCLPQVLVDAVIDRCRKEGIPYIADSQASSQVSDVSRFHGAELISATEHEVRLAVNDFKSGLQNVANRLLDKSGARMLFVKLGAEGMLILAAPPSFATSSLPAMNVNPVDVAGAGDALLAAAGLSLVAGANLWESAYIGSVAAGIQVSRVGNIPLEQTALLRELNL